MECSDNEMLMCIDEVERECERGGRRSLQREERISDAASDVTTSVKEFYVSSKTLPKMNYINFFIINKILYMIFCVI